MYNIAQSHTFHLIWLLCTTNNYIINIIYKYFLVFHVSYTLGLVEFGFCNNSTKVFKDNNIKFRYTKIRV